MSFSWFEHWNIFHNSLIFLNDSKQLDLLQEIFDRIFQNNEPTNVVFIIMTFNQMAISKLCNIFPCLFVTSEHID